ncbi:hypothetical protein B566_EDAN006190 [Ephemera danica]|nr:hypothetical protein B566_EDAN006190 [Ephemera danica]
MKICTLFVFLGLVGFAMSRPEWLVNAENIFLSPIIGSSGNDTHADISNGRDNSTRVRRQNSECVSETARGTAEGLAFPGLAAGAAAGAIVGPVGSIIGGLIGLFGGFLGGAGIGYGAGQAFC